MPLYLPLYTLGVTCVFYLANFVTGLKKIPESPGIPSGTPSDYRNAVSISSAPLWVYLTPLAVHRAVLSI